MQIVFGIICRIYNPTVLAAYKFKGETKNVRRQLVLVAFSRFIKLML